MPHAEQRFVALSDGLQQEEVHVEVHRHSRSAVDRYRAHQRGVTTVRMETTTPMVRARRASRHAAEPMGSEWRTDAGAVARVDGDRAFVLIKNNVGGLAGLDLAAKKVLFLVPVTVGYEGLSLEVVAGYPIVRSRTDGGYRGTIFDPMTGRVLYADTRLE